MTSRERLQKSPQIKEVAAIVQSGLFEHCADVALLTLMENISNPEDAVKAAANHYQLQGAKRILAILKDLATTPAEPKANTIGQLRRDV